MLFGRNECSENCSEREYTNEYIDYRGGGAMAELEVVFLLLGFVAIVSLFVVVPWTVVRVTVGVLEADTEAMIDRWTPSFPDPESEAITAAETDRDEQRSEPAHSEHGVQD